MSFKIGRNELCPCGSGKKFKKCCINNYNRMDAVPDDGIKMSAIILEMINEPLEIANDKSEMEWLIGLACTIWNMMIVPGTTVTVIVNFLLEHMDTSIGNSLPAELFSLISNMLELKQTKYPNVNKAILDYTITIRAKDDIHLYIVSSGNQVTIPEE